MSVIVNDSNICHRKVPTKQLSQGAKPPTFLANNGKGIKKGSISSSFSSTFCIQILCSSHRHTQLPHLYLLHTLLFPQTSAYPLYSYLIYSYP